MNTPGDQSGDARAGVLAGDALGRLTPGTPFLLHPDVLIDGISAEPIPGAVVGVDANGRIGAVGSAPDFGENAAAAIRVPVLMPGLVDCHAHPTLPTDRRAVAEQARVGDARMALTAVRQLGAHLRAGYTTVRDCGARGMIAFEVREAIVNRDFEGPRLLVCGRPVTHSGGHLADWGGVADGLDEIRKQVRILVHDGADAIKVVASGGSTGGIPFRASYTADELAVAVEAAHALGRSTIAHCRSTDSIDNALRAGIDVIAHLEFLRPGPIEDFGGGAPTGLPAYDEAVGVQLAKSRPWLDLNPQSSGWDTVVELRARDSHEGLTPADRDQLLRLERYFEGMIEVISRMRLVGLADRMAFGTDAGPFDTEFGHPEHNTELARLAGLSPMESIQVLTRNAAGACGIADTAGSVQPDMPADLLVLAQNPLEDPMAMRAVLAVFRSGRQVA